MSEELHRPPVQIDDVEIHVGGTVIKCGAHEREAVWPLVQKFRDAVYYGDADAAKLAKVRELIENAAPHWYCNKCGWFGDTGAEHSGCDYFAADVRSVRVAELTAILQGDSK